MDELAQDYLRQQIAFVFQHYGRYEATAAENIAYGDWPRLLDNPAAIQQVAEMAGVDDLIREMPNGYDTMLGRWFGEYTLSGGQWQNLAIARAFARPASLIILDEPTSNLDAMSEFQLYSRFRELATGRTAILISHRFSTVSMADRILVLDNGVIIESGKHNDLLERGGLYAQMYAIHRQNMYGTDIATTT
jgi:ATP-binding cassette subfamily B protein